MRTGAIKARIIRTIVGVACLSGSAQLLAQDAVPVEMWQRTFFIRNGNITGTAFSIDHKGKVYLVTARHVVYGLPDTGAVIQIRGSGEWKDYHTIKTLFPPSQQADIAVFETDERVAQPYQIQPTGEQSGPTFGQQVWFLGFPFEGIGSRFSSDKSGLLEGRDAAFIKRGTMSAIDAANPDAVLLYIDGFNNPGFSGGPILFWDFNLRKYFIAGVVEGYRNDTAKVVVNGRQFDTQFLVNSGILIAYDIRHAIQAIERDEAQESAPAK